MQAKSLTLSGSPGTAAGGCSSPTSTSSTNSSTTTFTKSATRAPKTDHPTPNTTPSHNYVQFYLWHFVVALSILFNLRQIYHHQQLVLCNKAINQWKEVPIFNEFQVKKSNNWVGNGSYSFSDYNLNPFSKTYSQTFNNDRPPQEL